MKVILNKDLAPLGEEGDVKEVARGYARNFLFPRGFALPYNDRTERLFESRRAQIETRKDEKRRDAVSLKGKLEALTLEVTMPAGANGKLFGAVTSQTIADELGKRGYPIERKRVELPGSTFKSVGKYRVTVKLYENAVAEVPVTVTGQEVKTEGKAAPARPPKRRARDKAAEGTEAAETAAVEAAGAGETAAPEASPVEVAAPAVEGTAPVPETAAVEAPSAGTATPDAEE
ncbi:MAG: 50S ribosomal protein L9 [Treponematales bacterium]